jgi:hypothetical protein
MPKSRIRRVRGDISPTANAELRYRVTDQEPQIPQTIQPNPYIQNIQDKEPEPTCFAEAEIHYGEARGRITVPREQAPQLLNVIACVAGIGGALIVCAMILRLYVGAPSILIAALCGLCVIVVAGLAGIAIFRNHS